MDVLLVGLVACMLVYVLFIGRNAWWFARIPREAERPDPLLPSVSIIIPARNEASNISKSLYTALQQDYPAGKLEVILVNDHSNDGTYPIARIMADRYPHLRILDLPEGMSGKKAALSWGIKHARGEVILQTDADCHAPRRWARNMATHFTGNTALVAGPIQLNYQSNSWIERFQAMESMGLVGIAAGSIASGHPNMCNGANLAYLKSAFLEVNGFQGIDQVASGDDELLMQKIRLHSGYSIRFAKCRDCIVSTQALPDWKSIKAQRLRWVSKARSYLDKRVNVIQLVSYFAFLSFPILLIASIWDSMYALIALELFVLKLVADFYLMHRTAGFFHKLPLLSYLIPLQMVYIPYVIWIGVAGNFVKKYKWKGRWVR